MTKPGALANERSNGKGEATGFGEFADLRRSVPFPGFAAMIQISKGAIAVIFVSRRTSDDPEGYARAAAEMEEEVISAPGYIGHDSVSTADGTAITVSYWRDPQSAAEWRAHVRHSEVRQEGRARWYSWYRLIVAEVDRAHHWHK